MELKRYQFCVNTSENCFLCLQLIPNNESNLQTPAFSLKTVLCYLKISLSELSSLSKRPPEILNRTDIKVSLCGDCEIKLKTFCEQFKSLEVLKMKVESSFETIKSVLNGDPTVELNYEEKVEGQARKHSQIVKELRQRIKNKKSWPRVVLNKIPEEAKYEEIVESVVKLEIPEESLNLDDTEEMESNPNKLDLTCKICKQLLSTPTHLKVHMRRHLLIKPFKCRYCKKSFVENWELKRHIWSHTGNRPIKCPLCPSTFSDQAHFLKHTKTHQGLRNFSSGVQSKNKTEDDNVESIFEDILPKCDLCRKVFISEEYLQMHLKYHRQDSPFLCKKCEMDFSSKDALKAHMDQNIHKKFNLSKVVTTISELPPHKTVHKEPEALPDPLAIPESPPHSPNGLSNLQCNVCGKAFLREEILKIHFLKVHTDKNLPCPVCNEVFPSKVILKNHLKTHQQSTSFKCHLCPMAYTLKTKLARHISTAHSAKQRPWKCSDCGMGFLSKQNLKQHLETHKGKKQFRCGLCTSQFTYMKGLQFHFKMHHGRNDHTVELEPKIEVPAGAILSNASEADILMTSTIKLS